MGKHNGKARKTGITVGLTLSNRSSARNKQHKVDGRHTTDIGQTDRPNMQSIIERNDLDEFLAMAELQGREFAGERGTNDIIVVTEGTVAVLDSERSAEERATIEERHASSLVIPRRPPWERGMTAEQLDDVERAMFLSWRRDLALLEEQEHLCLTPYEKNLEVWRQLWRVLERSDCVVQVLDARDPLRYYSEDLQSYAETIHPTKRTLLLLNKSDLLSKTCRKEWARYFEGQGVDYVFWSARRAIDQHKLEKQAQKLKDAGGLDPNPTNAGDEEEDTDPDTRVVGIDELIHRLGKFASECVASMPSDGGSFSRDPDARLMVGLVGYPNVGKSSTINALYGSKKTSVAPTPGKTKHFQTLMLEGTNISLCDCPGLVLPKFAASKAEMVAAGVVPIDRLTDVVPPVDVVSKKAGRAQVRSCPLTFALTPQPHPPPSSPFFVPLSGPIPSILLLHSFAGSTPSGFQRQLLMRTPTGRQSQWKLSVPWH